MPELLTPEQMAQRLGVSSDTLLQWAIKGRVPRIKVNARIIRFDPEAVLRALQEEEAEA